MARERVKKKSFQESLEEIKEKMKEKRNKRLATVSGPNRGRSRRITTCNVTSSTNTLLKGVQQNNKALAVALQAEKEKVRQANVVILQLKREQQALFLHLLLLKKKLKEQEALSANLSENSSSNNIGQTESQGKEHNKSANKTPQKGSPVHADEHHGATNAVLPPTVGVRRRQTDRSSSRRRFERVQEHRIMREDSVARLDTLTASPICIDDAHQKQTHPVEETTEEFQHSTPEPAPARSTKQPQQSRKQQSKPKADPPPKKPERGRKAERGPLKKPWENPKPRARSKSRDRSATRSKTAPTPTSQNKLNTSLGFNDTFDFDCEEAVHITPFKAKAEDNEPVTAVSTDTQSKMEDTSPVVCNGKDSLSPPSSESEDSLYVPQKSRKKHSLPENTTSITTRRGRRSSKVTDENIILHKEFNVYRDEDSSSKIEKSKKDKISEEQEGIYGENEGPEEADIEEHCLRPVSPLVEAEIKRIDDVLSNFGDSSNDNSPLLTDQTPQRVKSCKKRGLGVRPRGRGLSLCDVTNMSPAAYRKFPCGGSRLSGARCSTPAQAPTRKRRCTMTVDYKEPSLNAKLRRGDKFTDLEFLRSPIFKQKSGRRSVQKPRSSMKMQQPFEKYNESFVGCL